MSRILTYLANLLTLVATLILAWMLTVGIFYVVTSGGGVYSTIASVMPECGSEGRVDQTSYVASCSHDGPKAMHIDVYHQSKPILSVDVAATSAGLDLSWEHPYSNWERLSEYLGYSRRRGTLPVFTLSDSWWFTPFAKDINVTLPAGAIAPQLKQVLTESRDAAEIDMSDASRDTISERIASEIFTAVNWSTMSSNIATISLWDGRIQFVTLFMFWVSCISLVVGVGLPWARALGSSVIQLILYVGFFGTLAGMSGALEVLGNADLTNPLSKGTKLGPIGSQIALAINTTMYAVILFGAALMLDLWLRSIVEEELDATQNWINRRAVSVIRWSQRLLGGKRLGGKSKLKGAQ